MHARSLMQPGLRDIGPVAGDVGGRDLHADRIVLRHRSCRDLEQRSCVLRLTECQERPTQEKVGLRFIPHLECCGEEIYRVCIAQLTTHRTAHIEHQVVLISDSRHLRGPHAGFDALRVSLNGFFGERARRIDIDGVVGRGKLAQERILVILELAQAREGLVGLVGMIALERNRAEQLPQPRVIGRGFCDIENCRVRLGVTGVGKQGDAALKCGLHVGRIAHGTSLRTAAC